MERLHFYAVDGGVDASVAHEPDEYGDYVEYSVARAEIERLEKEVERLKLDSRKGQKDYCDLMDRYDTAWNDAIEAAAARIEAMGFTANFIRALKRRQP